MGIVWRALHREQKLPVAVKVLTASRSADPQFQKVFRREVRSVASLDHPGIVYVLDHGSVGAEAADASEGRLRAGSPWLAMELAEGGSLLPWCGELDYGGLQVVLLQVLDALAHAHARRVIHRDLKPGNVLLRRPGDLSSGVLLTDFGLARADTHDLDEEINDGWLGTPNFMAPEQFDSTQPVGPWTDLYGLGCLAWALTTGTAPFAHLETPENIRQGHMELDVPAFKPRSEVPRYFEGWLRRLLSKNPGRRYRWVFDATTALQGLGTPDSTLIPAGWSHDGANPLPETWAEPDRPEDASRSTRTNRLMGAGLGLFGMRAIPIVGRKSERDMLWKVLARVHDAQSSRAVLLRGPPGCGKTALANWIMEQAHSESGAHTISAVHGPLSGPRDGIGGMISRHLKLGGLSREQVLLRLERFLRFKGVEDPREWENLTEVVRPDPSGHRLATASERHAQVRRYLESLCQITPTPNLPPELQRRNKRPVVVCLDNIQWGLESIDLARHILDVQEANPAPILLVLTVREDDVARERIVKRLVEGLMDHDRLVTVDVHPLPKEERGELVREILGLEGALAAQVEERTGGHPQFAQQLVGDLVRRGLLEQGDRGFRLVDGATLELPDDLHEVWMVRLQQGLRGRPDSDLQTLEVAAVLGEEVNDEEWRNTCAREGIEPTEGLPESLVREGLVRPSRDPSNPNWSFAHAMVRECLERSAREAQRWEGHHHTCAEMLEGRTGTRFDERRGRHLLAAGNQEQAMDILLEAARERRESSDIAIAERLLDQHAEAMRSLGLPETDPRGVQNQLQRARICLMQQEFDASEGWATKVEKTAREQSQPDALAEILTVRALIATAKGDLAQASSLLEDAEGIEGVDTRVRSGLQVAKATVLVRRGEFAASAEYSRRALEGFESVGDLKGAGQAHRSLALYLRDRSRYDEERSHLKSALECFQAFGMRRGMADVLNDLGESARHEGDLVEADAHYKSSVELFRSLGDPDLAIPRLNRGLVMFERGRHQHARLYLEGCLETYRHQGRKSLQAMTHVSLLGCCAALSDWKACDAHMTWSQVLLGQTGLVAEDIANLAQFTAETAQSQEKAPLAQDAWCLARDQWAALGHQGRADAIGARIDGS